MRSIRRLAVLAGTLAVGGCDGAKGDGREGEGEVGMAQMTLSESSCPVTPAIDRLLWEVVRGGGGGSGGGRLYSVPISRMQIDAHCMGVATELVALSLVGGQYESLVSAFDRSGNVINDLGAATSTFMITPNRRTPVPARIVAARGTGFANGSWSVDNASFEEGGAPLGGGCCTPQSCSPESYVGCKRATQNGICNGWVSPCPY